jgi:hypothetical protein
MTADKSVYYVSSRPEAYEYHGEIDHEQARRIGELIVRHAAERFPNIEFRLDDAWHDHLPGMTLVAAYIDGNWQQWLADDETLSYAA